tara:strand:- start:25522 stop:25872 length:351 start_codon:yes stop_codon:yes gene_type:complete
LDRYSWVLEDKNDALVFKDIAQLKKLSEMKNAFQSKSDVPYIDFTTSAYWMELNVQNSIDSDRRFILELAKPLTNQVDLYILNNQNSIVKEFHKGDDFVFEQRTYDYRKFVFPIEF